MSDVIERIKRRIEARRWVFAKDTRPDEAVCMQWANRMNSMCLEIIDKEVAKEPQIVRTPEEITNVILNGFNLGDNCDMCNMYCDGSATIRECNQKWINWLTGNEVEIEPQEEVCEWKFEDGIAWNCNGCETLNNSYLHDMKDIFAEFECKCKHCGKKIKVVE